MSSLWSSLQKNEPKEVFSRPDIVWFSAYTIGIVLIMIIIGVGFGLLCFLLFLNRS